MIDGAGLVYEKQGGTGASAFVGPNNDKHLDSIANDLNQQYNIRLQNKLYEDRQKAADKQKFYNQEIDWQAWDVDNNRELAADAIAVKQRMAQLKTSGLDPRDYSNPASKEFQDLQMGLMNKVAASKQQKADYIKLRDMIEADRNSQTPQYDYEKSMEALNSYAMAPSISDRAKVQPNSLLVAKEKQYSTYAPIEKLKINDFVGKYGTDSPTGGTRGTALNKANLKAHITALANDPINDEHYNWGLNKGLWKTRDEYANTQYNEAKLRFTPDFEKTIKVPKDSEGKGLTEDDIKTIVNTAPAKIKIAEAYTDGTPRERDGKPVLSDATLYYPQSVGNINLVIPSASAFNSASGTKGQSAENYKLTDGTLGVALKKKDGDYIIHDPNPNENETGYVFKDKNGNKIKLSKEEAVKQGYLEYIPVIVGNGEYYDPTEKKNVKTPIVVEASKFINKVNGKESQPLNDAYNKLTVQKQLADKLNKGESKSYKIGGYEYTEDEIDQAAKASGLTKDQYLKSVGAE